MGKLTDIFKGNVSGESPDWVTRLPEADETDQLLTVAAYMGSAAWVALHKKDEKGRWQMIMTTPGAIGYNGLGKTKEGDLKTPIGSFHFDKAFGLADDPGCIVPYTKVNEDHYWSGDKREGMHFNELVNIKDCPGLDTERSEHLVEYKRQYQYCLNIDYNKECDKTAGYAIFLHCLGPKSQSTEGCVAIPEDQMKVVMENVTPDCIIVINTQENLRADI